MKNQESDRPLLVAALERGHRFTAEIDAARDDAIAAQLLAAWKDLILEEMVKLLRITNDPQTLGCLDNQIAVGQENAAWGGCGRKAK